MTKRAGGHGSERRGVVVIALFAIMIVVGCVSDGFDVEVAPGLTGTLVGSDGAGVPGGFVTARLRDGSLAHSVTAGPDGRFHLPIEEPGVYDVHGRRDAGSAPSAATSVPYS